MRSCKWKSSRSGIIVAPVYGGDDIPSSSCPFKVWDLRQHVTCIRTFENHQLDPNKYKFDAGVLCGLEYKESMTTIGYRRYFVACYHDLRQPEPTPIRKAEIDLAHAICIALRGYNHEGDGLYGASFWGSDIRSCHAASATDDIVHITVSVKRSVGNNLFQYQNLGLLVLRLYRSKNILEPLCMVNNEWALASSLRIRHPRIVGRFMFTLWYPCRLHEELQDDINLPNYHGGLYAIDLKTNKVLWNIPLKCIPCLEGHLIGPDCDLGIIGCEDTHLGSGNLFFDFSYNNRRDMWDGRKEFALPPRISDLLSAIHNIPFTLKQARSRLFQNETDRPDFTTLYRRRRRRHLWCHLRHTKKHAFILE